jgi:hypothetical protein
MADATPTEPHTPTSPRRLVSTGYAAAFCGVTPYAIRTWVHAGKLRGYRVGPAQRTIRVDLDAVAALVNPVVP